MKRDVITIDKPIPVVQVFGNHVDIRKPRWRDGSWRAPAAWKSTLRSMTGWVENDRVVLNEAIRERRDDLHITDILLLLDFNNYLHVPPPVYTTGDFPGGRVGSLGVHPTFPVDYESGNLGTARYYLLSTTSRASIRYGPYDLLKGESGVELHLVGSRGNLGLPRRGDFKLADLDVGSPIRTVINGRFDNTDWFYRADRTYRYQEDIFIHLGDFRRFEIYPWNEMAVDKPVPLDSCRSIDLEQDLY